MILKALYDYYHRSGDLPPMGFEKKEIYFIIVISEKGDFIRIEDTRDGKTPKSFIVPRGETRSSGIKANLLWDNVEYVLAVPKEDNDSAKAKAIEKNKAFIERCQQIAFKFPEIKELKAVCDFYKNGVKNVESASNWNDVLKERTRNVSFQLNNSLTIIPAMDFMISCLSECNPENENAGMHRCLVTGKIGDIVRLTSSTFIPEGKATASLVAFQTNSGYDSYGKEQCYNAPISKEAESAYITALKKLTDKDSRNKFYLGNRTFLFWTSNVDDSSEEVEKGFWSLFASAKNDDPNRNIAKVKETLKSVWSGKKNTADKDRFYMLGLAPNAARIAVVYWNECSIKEFAGKILQHFSDMEIS